MRIYDPRVGRFLSVDPLSKSYPWNSPYAYAENDVLRNIDLDGGEKKHYLLVWDEKHEKATLTYSRTEHFTETNTKWTPTLTDWTKTTTTTVKDPRVEYVVHGTVSVPMSADGMFKDDVQAATWTFATAEKMFGKENARREYAAKGAGGWGPANDWSYASSDQRYSIMGSQMLMYGIEAQATKTIYSPNVFRGGIVKGNSNVENNVNLASPQRTLHIIEGDATGGGHAWFGSLKSFVNGITGKKSMFPVTWSNAKIMNAISHVAVNNTWIQQTGPAGALVTNAGNPVRYVVTGVYQSIKIKVVTTPTDIITAFPIK